MLFSNRENDFVVKQQKNCFVYESMSKLKLTWTRNMLNYKMKLFGRVRWCVVGTLVQLPCITVPVERIQAVRIGTNYSLEPLSIMKLQFSFRKCYTSYSIMRLSKRAKSQFPFLSHFSQHGWEYGWVCACVYISNGNRKLYSPILFVELFRMIEEELPKYRETERKTVVAFTLVRRGFVPLNIYISAISFIRLSELLVECQLFQFSWFYHFIILSIFHHHFHFLCFVS